MKSVGIMVALMVDGVEFFNNFGSFQLVEHEFNSIVYGIRVCGSACMQHVREFCVAMVAK